MKQSRCFRGLLLILSMVIFSWASPALDAEEIELGVGDGFSDYRPGMTNPVANPDRRCLLAEDQLGVATHNSTQKMLQYWNAPVDDYLKDWEVLSGTNNWSVPKCNIASGPVAAAKGRVLSMLKDDAFIAFYTNDGDAVKPVVGYMTHPLRNYVIPGTYYEGYPRAHSAPLRLQPAILMVK